MNIKRAKLPHHSILKNDSSFEFIDSYQAEFTDEDNSVDSTKIGKLFFVSSPSWIDRLFTFRNKLVGMLGLKTAGEPSGRDKELEAFKCEPGEQIGLFKVFDKTDTEVVLGEDDKHLDFRVSLFLEQQDPNFPGKHLTISTTVRFNNWFGKVYFIPVRPFHKLIVPVMLKGILHKLGEK